MSEIDNNTPGQKPHTGILAAASLVLSILAILAVILSIRRIEAVQSLPGCLVAETPKYRLVHSLCTILPTTSLAAGIVALLRMLRRHSRLWGKILAAGGIAISAAVLIIYWFNLTHLASGHIH
ncbi:MAG: hypothetical protein H8D56_25285 [Planctomycetes bacterium]|nr:hypothetical protein [Planctomycetota bacterium]MBL7145678.1 hypothetical protein [Phycisphaerae bacterium]